MVKMATGSTKVASAEQKVASAAATPLSEPTVDTSGWDVSENQEGDAEMIATFKDVAFAASAHAPRFKVQAVRASKTEECSALLCLGVRLAWQSSLRLCCVAPA
jgi:hypothetical protein